MHLTERVLADAGSLQQELVQRLIVALRLGLDRLPAEIINGGAETRLDLGARNVELLGDHVEVERDAAFRWRGLLRRGDTGSEQHGSHGKNRGDASRPHAYQVHHRVPRVKGAPR
ncbi:MAG: hypothetical protein E6G90_03595 [Alphaproteobacteria bacterium]|nr:MAG: hypothetical protein E6G90_03595 [Alphaproteobacteria bacterium]